MAYVKSRGGVLVPEEHVRNREVWTYDDSRKLRRFMQRLEKEHKLGVKLICLKCQANGESGDVVVGQDALMGYPTVMCPCTLRLFQEEF